MIIWAGSENQSFAGRILSAKPLVFLGALSYSLYLWHWPSLVLARYYFGRELKIEETLLTLSIAMLAALFSLYFIEKPILENGNTKTPYLKVGLAVATSVSFMFYIGIYANGFPNRFPESSQVIFSASSDFNPLRYACHDDGKIKIPYEEKCKFGANNKFPDVAVWGDSHGAELVVAVGERLAKEGRAAMQITASACPPATGYQLKERPYCKENNDEVLDHLVGDARIKTVILAANFIGYRSESFPKMLSGYTNVVSKLRQAGKRVIIIYPIPVFDFDPPSVLGMRSARGESLLEVGISLETYHFQNLQAIGLLNGIISNDEDKYFPRKYFVQIISVGHTIKTWAFYILIMIT